MKFLALLVSVVAVGCGSEVQQPVAKTQFLSAKTQFFRVLAGHFSRGGKAGAMHVNLSGLSKPLQEEAKKSSRYCNKVLRDMSKLQRERLASKRRFSAVLASDIEPYDTKIVEVVTLHKQAAEVAIEMNDLDTVKEIMRRIVNASESTDGRVRLMASAEVVGRKIVGEVLSEYNIKDIAVALYRAANNFTPKGLPVRAH